MKNVIIEFQTVFFKGMPVLYVYDLDTVVITGGRETQTTVSRYNDQEWVEDLPGLSSGRYMHACAGYTSGGRRVRSYEDNGKYDVYV